jgi:putative aldouronate transport system substrate-binding protein
MKTIKIGLAGIYTIVLLGSGCTSSLRPDSIPGESGLDARGTGTELASAQEKLVLNWFVHGANSASLPSRDKDFVRQAIERKFNVELNVEHMQMSNDYTNRLNLRLAGSKAPDLFMVDGGVSNKYIMDRVAMDLTELVTPQTMPNYFKYWITETELKRYQVQDMFRRAPVPYPKRAYISYYVRKDWLDKLGLPIPKTYEDMIETMKAFTFKDPDGNGKQDTYGFTTAGSGYSVPIVFPEFYKNGIYGGLMLEDDMFVDGTTDPRIEQVFTDLLETLRLGVIDKDWFLQKSGEDINKAVQGKVGIVISGGAMAAYDHATWSIQYRTKEVLRQAGKPEEAAKVDWQPFHPWADTGVATTTLPGAPFLFSSKTTVEKAKRSIQILDWLASEEGFMLTRFGIEGVHYTRDGNKITIDPVATKRDIADNGYFLAVYGFFSQGDVQTLGLEVFQPDETERDRKIFEKISSYVFKPSIGTNVAPPTGLDISSFRKEMWRYQVKVLFEDKSAANWPKYRQELMTTHRGKDIFEAYARQMSGAFGRTIGFRAEP